MHTDSDQIKRIVSRLGELTTAQRREVEQFVDRIASQFESPRSPQDINQSGTGLPQSKDWPHAPLHRLSGKGTFIVTAGTLHKEHLFNDAARLDLLESRLLTFAREFDWQLEAWAVFSNHYHFVGTSLEDASSLKPFLAKLHSETGRMVNQWDGVAGRQVWHNFWDTELTFETSYFARLNYVHHNAVKHGLVRVANQYRWCSASWFERAATPAQVKTIYSFKTERLKVFDEFDVIAVQ